MQRKVWFQLVDAATRDAYDGHTSDSLRVDPATVEDVDDLRTAIFDKLRQSLPPHVIPTMLRVFANGASYSAGQRQDEDTRIGGLGCMEADALIVEVNASASARPIRSILSTGVTWLGVPGSKGNTTEGADMDDPRVLPRTALVDEIIQRLEETNVLLATNSSMTGKTTLASLVCRELVARSRAADRKRVVVINMTALFPVVTFEERVRLQCGLRWTEITALPSQGYTVYVVLDEVQSLYDEFESGPPCREFWHTVKVSLGNAALRLHIFMVAAYKFTRLSTPLHLSDSQLLRSHRFNFTADEIVAYVENWFDGVAVLRTSARLEPFCDMLEALTGGHVGLCVTTIGVLNDVWRSVQEGAIPTADEWIAMLYHGKKDRYVYTVHVYGLFHELVESRAVRAVDTLTIDEQRRVEAITMGGCARLDDEEDQVQSWLRRGFVVEAEGGHFQFSSPVMWRCFIRLRVASIERALLPPSSLVDLMLRVAQTMDYPRLRDTLAASALLSLSDRPLAWRTALYHAVYRCTPRAFKTSADVGALFGASGFLDFTVQGTIENKLEVWGIELVRERSRLAEHTQRFATGGTYSALGLTDYCLLEFRRVAAIDAAVASGQDVGRCAKLLVVYYNAELTDVAMVDACNSVLFRSPRA